MTIQDQQYQAAAEGVTAYTAGKQLTDNPYHEMSKMWAYWIRGWRQELQEQILIHQLKSEAMKASDIQIKPADYTAITKKELTTATLEWTEILEKKEATTYEANKNILLRRNIHELCIECERQNLDITEVLKLLKARKRKRMVTGNLFNQ